MFSDFNMDWCRGRFAIKIANHKRGLGLCTIAARNLGRVPALRIAMDDLTIHAVCRG